MASDDRNKSGLSFKETAQAMTSFIEVAIHTILRIRQVYPTDLFVRRKKYDMPVYQSRHPGLNEYISGVVLAIGDELFLGALDKVVLLIKDKSDQPLERFIFALKNVVDVAPANVDEPITNALTLDTLKQYFRAFLVKLIAMDSQLGELSNVDDLSFAVIIECKDGHAPSASADEDEPPPWIATSTHHTSSGTTDGAELHVVKAVETGVINMTLVVQESETKLARSRQIAPSKSTPTLGEDMDAGHDTQPRYTKEEKGKGRAG